MSDSIKCGRIRGWMATAASGLLAGAQQGEFEEHIGDCAACRAEFARIENLLGRIEESLRAELTVEPSPKLVLWVRETIAAETQSARLTVGWLGRNSWLGTAGVCVAVAALLIFVVAHRGSRPMGNFAPHPQIANSAPTRVPSPPRRSASAENIAPRAQAPVRVNKPRLTLARHESPRNTRLNISEPEVIVQPGQMQAILQFVAETRNGKINGGEIEKGIKAAERPLEIKPLNIAPLETSRGDTNEDPTNRAPGSAGGRSD